MLDHGGPQKDRIGCARTRTHTHTPQPKRMALHNLDNKFVLKQKSHVFFKLN